MKGSWSGTTVPPPEGQYKDPGVLGKALIALLALTALVNAGGVVSDLSYAQLIGRARAGELVTIGDATAAESRLMTIAGVQLLLLLVTGIVMIVWTRRLYRNLGPLGVRQLRFKAGWAVGAWFFPIMNAIRPKEILNDVWRANDPALPPVQEDGPGLGRAVHPVINWWWAVFLLSGAFGQGAGAQSTAATLEELGTYAWITLAADSISLVAAVLAAVAVRMITQRQQERATTLQARFSSLVTTA